MSFILPSSMFYSLTPLFVSLPETQSMYIYSNLQ